MTDLLRTYSIAIPAYDEEASIGPLVRHLLATSPPGLIEIVVGDSLSNDGTAAAVTALTALDKRVRLVVGMRPGKPAMWNQLIASVSTDQVVFFDADVHPTRGCVAALLRELDRGDRIAVGGRRTPTGGGDRLTRFLSDPVIETCLAGPGYAVKRSRLLQRMAELEYEVMPEVFAEDNWLLGLLHRGEFAVVDDAMVQVAMDSRRDQRLVSARRRLVRHELDRDPVWRNRIDTHHPEALRPLDQARHVLRGPYGPLRKLRWLGAGGAKMLADVIWPVGATAEQLIAAYERDPAGVLRSTGSTSQRPIDGAAVRVRPATPDDAAAYAQLENLAAGGGTRRLYGRAWPHAIQAEFRAGTTRHGYPHVLCAELEGEVVGIVAVVGHDQCQDESPPGLWSWAIDRWRRHLDHRPTPITLPGEAAVATMAVAEHARRAGVGRLLHEATVTRAAELDATALVQETAFDNEAALSMHRNLGFVDLTTRSNEPSALLYKPLDATAERRARRHRQFHQDGFLTDTIALADLAVRSELLDDAALFDAAIAGRGERAEVPYFFTPAIEKVAFDSAIESVVRSILRTDDWVVWGPNIRRDTPNDAHRWHIDLESWYWPSITVAVGLEGCTPEAATWFLPGTAPLSLFPTGADADGDETARQLAASHGADSTPRQWQGLADGRFGVFDAKTWHRGDPRTSAGRTMLFLHYQRAADPRVPTMVDHDRHRWSRNTVAYRANRGATSTALVNTAVVNTTPVNTAVAHIPVRERARRVHSALPDIRSAPR